MVVKSLEIRDKTVFDGIFVKYILKSLFLLWFKLTGWQTTKSAPEGAGITIAAPHTSNWDFIYALAAAILFDIKIYFSVKDSWCRIPVIGSVMMWLGAIPIDRSSGAQGQVDKIKRFVERHKERRIFFLFTPEGTRGKVEQWKTGFYHVAEDCGLPIFLAKVDYRTKESGPFHAYQLTGDKAEDVRAIQESYKNIYAKFPEDQCPSYVGPIPEISDTEARIMRAMYSLKGVATQVDIAAKAKLGEFSTAMLDYLIEKGVLEQLGSINANGDHINENEPTYRLTFAGKGCLLHLFPTLA